MKKKIKPKLKKYGDGGKYEWSKKDMTKTYPVTQTNSTSSITTGNKKLSAEELKKAAEYTKQYNQKHLEEEYNNRQSKLKASVDAQKQPLSLKNLQTQTQSTGDKFSLAMNTKYGNPKDYPTLSGYMEGLDYINPAKIIGDMSSGIGSVPQDVKDGNYLKAGMSIGSPLFAGAVAGIGTKGIKPFVNNLTNPLAGLNFKNFKQNNIITPDGFQNRVFDSNIQLGSFQGKGHLSEKGYNYRTLGDGELKAIQETQGVFPKTGKAKGGNENVKYWTKGNEKNWYAENPNQQVIRVKEKNFKNNNVVHADNVEFYNHQTGKFEPVNNYKPFKSEINWGKWNKEIPDNKPLMQEYNTIDYRKNPLSDKEKEMYQWFDEQMRFDKLPQTTNKQSIEVLDNFKQRIRTPEGQKRLKELGITEEQLLQDLKIVEDPNTYGYYRGLDKNTIAINPNHPLPKKVVRHEIEHGVQNALRKSKINKVIDGTPAEKLKALESATTEIDDILSGLSLRREGTPNKVWNKINTNEPVNINNYKSLINNKQHATDYFLTGSDGAEKSAFLGEVQQYMMDTGKIPKNSYVEITPEMVKETMIDAMFDEAGGGKYLRLFNIIKADPKNYEIISKGLNKMLTVTPLIGVGAYMQNNEYRNGGIIGNNEMFDMTNPNIYKALFPAAIGLGAASQIPKKEFGGNITTENEWELVNEDLPKAGNGLSLVKTLTPIGNRVRTNKPSLYKNVVNNVDKIEHNINDKYRVQADDFTDKFYPTDYDEDSGHNDYVDALRHSATAMYTTSGQGKFLSPLKIPYTNVMGLAHELKGLVNYVNEPGNLTWQGAKQQLKETGSDLYNNFVGSVIGGLPTNIENKEKILKFAKDKNILSDLSKKENGGKLPKRKLNLKKSNSDWEIIG